MTPIPTRFQVTDSAEFKEASPNVINALNSLPTILNPIITSTKRSWGNTKNKSGMHPIGKALDIRDDEEGNKLWYWGLTPEGKKWKEENGVTMLAESDHYHLEFNK